MIKNEVPWQCECGNVEYSSSLPEECGKCFRIDSFIQLTGVDLENINPILESDEEDFSSNSLLTKKKRIFKRKKK